MIQALEAVREELQTTLRMLRRSRGFTLAVLVTLGVGVGSNLATLSVLDRLLFRPPPGVNDGHLVRRVSARERSPQGRDWVSHAFSVPDHADFVDAVKGSATIAAYREGVNLALGDSTRSAKGAFVSEQYFSLLGLSPRLGRFFDANESAGLSSGVAVISEPLWRNVFGSDAGAVGRVVQIAGAPVTIIGVIEGAFQGIDLEPMDVWLPLAVAPPMNRASRDTRALLLLVRIDAADQDRAIADRLTARYRRTRTFVLGGDTAAVVGLSPLAEARSEGLLSSTDQRSVAMTKRLAGVSLAVLLVTVANVAVLFLVRVIRRRKELAVRSALGADRLRVVLQLGLEGIVLGSIAGVLAAVLGAWFARVLGAWLLPPSAVGHSVDARELVASVVLTIGIACASSVAAALFGQSAQGEHALRLTADGADPRGVQLRRGLLATQVSLSIALITIAATFQQSLMRLARTDLGMDREKVVNVSAFGQALRAGAMREASRRMATIPQVVAVANASGDLAPGSSVGRFSIPGEPDVPIERTPSYNLVDTAYFRAVGIQLIRGRAFKVTDDHQAEAVAVVTESMAETFWPERDPIGKCFIALGDTSRCVRVVGVARDVRWDLNGPRRPHFYMPLAQHGLSQGHVLVVRTRDPAEAKVVAEIDRFAASILGDGTRRPRVARVSDRLDRQIRPWKAASTLFLLFGVLALLASFAGIYATVTYELAQRRTEFGVRLALGATLVHLLEAIVRPVATACVVGACVGAVLALAGGRLMAAFLFDTSPADPIALGIGALTVATGALAAVLTPTWKLTRVSLSTVLRT